MSLPRSYQPRGGGTVLFLCHSAKPSGAELALLRLSARMPTRASGPRVLVAFAEAGPVVDMFRAAGIDAQVVAAPGRGLRARRGGGLVSTARAAFGLLQHGRQVDCWASDRDVVVVVARSIKSLLYGAVVARRLGVPLVWSVHDRIAADYLGRLPALAVRALGRYLPDAYVVNSRCTLATIRTGSKPVLHAPPAMDPAAMAAPRPASPRVDHVVMVGRLAPWKGQHVFLEAFTRTFSGTSTRATVVGGPLFGEREYETALHRVAASGPCADQIRFTGHVEDVARHLRSADVLVHASTVPEPFGLVVTEGMAAGCAVVATAPGGPAEVITDGVDGLLVGCGDVDALAAALLRLADDPALRAALTDAGQRTAAGYDVASTATITTPWLQRVASGAELPVFVSAVPTSLSSH